MIEQWTGRRGKQAEGSDVMNTGKRDMTDEPGDELVRGESHELDLGSCFVLVAQKKCVGGYSEEAAVRDRAASDIVTEVLNNTTAMFVWWHDPDMPLCSAKAVEEVNALLMGKTVRQPKLPGIERFAQEGKKLAPEFRPQNTGRKKEALPCVEPMPVRGKAASGNEQMDMWMYPKGLAPTVK